MSSTTDVKNTFFEKPSNILAFVQILILIMMGGYLFAVVETEQNTQKGRLDKHEVIIESNQQKIQEHDVRQAVTTEQYRQIIKKLDNLEKKMDARR